MRSAFSTCLTALLGLPILAFSGAEQASAQAVPVDQGTFDVTLDGESAGTETFSIRRSGSGPDAVIIATAEIDLEVPDGRLGLTPMLQASGAEMAVTAYQIKTSGHTQEEVILRPADGRYMIRVRSEQGDREREFRASPGTVLLDTNVAHQYYFVTSRLPTGSGTIPVIIPRQGAQFDLRVTDLGQESLSIAGSSVQGRHLRLEGSGATTDVWADDDGRILRVERSDTGYQAVRTSLP